MLLGVGCDYALMSHRALMLAFDGAKDKQFKLGNNTSFKVHKSAHVTIPWNHDPT